MKITSDDHAWALLEQLLKSDEIPDVKFDGWPVLHIKVNGDDYKASLNSGQMAALVHLERVFGRAYSVVAHGAYDKRRLKQDEEEDLQFTTKVKEGSSILETDFTPLVKAFAAAVAANPQTALLAAVVIGLALVAKPVILKYYETRAKQVDLDDKKLLLDAVKIGKEEEAKNKLLEKAVKRLEGDYPQFAQVVPDAKDAFWEFASSSVDADSLTIKGITLSQDELEMLASRRRRRNSESRKIVEKCKVKGVKAAGASYSVALEGKNIALSATFRRPQLTSARLGKLMKLFADGAQIEATIEVKVVDKAQLSGRLINFKKLD